MQCINCSVVWSDLFIYAHKLDMSLKMIEICQKSKQNNEWQIARNHFSLLMHTKVIYL